MANRPLDHLFMRERMRPLVYAASAATGVVSGLVIVAYRAAIHALESARAWAIGAAQAGPASSASGAIGLTAAGVLGAAALGYLVYRMTKAAPHIKGSGIPQVKAALMRRIEPLWRRELPLKFAGGSLALGAGLSLGREGPSIQLGALIGQGLAELSGRPELRRYLITAGAAAGISAAFNAPLAGVLFCVEELHRNVSPAMLLGALISSFAANAVMWIFQGHDPVFGLAIDAVLPLSSYGTGVLALGLAAGLVGVLFSRGLLAAQRAYAAAAPSAGFRMASAFAVAAVVAVAAPALAGGGEALIASVASGSATPGPLVLLLAAKLAFTLFCYASGAPGGIFLPMLTVGALLGAVANGLGGSGAAYLDNYMLLGMVGLFAAVVRAPVTGAVLITEMAGSFAHFPSFIFVSIIASLVAGALRTEPIYDSLLERLAPDHPAASGSRPTVLYVPIQEGSVLDSCPGTQRILPEGCILAAVEHGDKELFPAPELDLQPGDVIKVIVPEARAYELKERLLALGEAEERPAED